MFFYSISDLYKLLKPDFKTANRYIVPTILFTLAYIATTIVGPYLLGLTIDQILPQKDLSGFLVISVFLTLNYIIGYYVFNVQVELHYKYSTSIFKAFRSRLFESIVRKKYFFYKNHTPSDLLTHYSFDVQVLQDYFREYFISFFVNSISVLAVLVFLFLWNWELALLSLAAIPASVYFILLNNHDLETKAREANRELRHLNEKFLDTTAGIHDIHFFQVTENIIRKFHAFIRKYLLKRSVSSLNSALSSGSISSMGLYMTLFPIIIGGIMICLDYPGITIGELVSYHTYLQQCSKQMQDIFCSITHYSNIHPYIERLQKIIDTGNLEIKNYSVNLLTCVNTMISEDENIADTISGFDIHFRNITFHYPNFPPLFNCLSLEVKYGEKACIVGPSGIGKSTIFHLLMRYYHPDKGKILLGRVPISSISDAEYYQHFGYVSKDSHLFSDSVFENITMGDHRISHLQVKDVLEKMHMISFVESLPNGIYTILNSRKIRLSQGQIQRLTLARAMIRNPEILLLDEFSSSIDDEIEEDIFNTIFDYFSQSTIIAITHDKRAISKFNHIIRMKKYGTKTVQIEKSEN